MQPDRVYFLRVFIIVGKNSATTDFKSPYSRKSILNGLNQNVVGMTVSGNSDLQVGQTILFDIPSAEPKTDKFIKDEYFSGKRLITGLRHLVTQTEYTTVVEVAKDSLAKSI